MRVEIVTKSCMLEHFLNNIWGICVLGSERTLAIKTRFLLEKSVGCLFLTIREMFGKFLDTNGNDLSGDWNWLEKKQIAQMPSLHVHNMPMQCVHLILCQQVDLAQNQVLFKEMPRCVQQNTPHLEFKFNLK